MEDRIPFPSSTVPEGRREETWVVLEDDEQVALFLKEWGNLLADRSRIVCWADLPARVGEIEHLNVYFQANTHSGFRKAERLEHDLRFLEKLKSLNIPRTFVPTLDPDLLPASLQRLEISREGRASFPKGSVFPHIKVLVGYNAQIMFGPGAFPDVCEVASSLEPKRKLLDVLATYPRLDALNIGPIKDAHVFEKYRSVPINFLYIHSGSTASLDGVEQIPELRYLGLKNLNRLTDISALERCETLEVLELRYCANLRDHDSFLRIPRLKGIRLWACDALDPKACEADLASRPQLRSNVMACTGKRR